MPPLWCFGPPWCSSQASYSLFPPLNQNRLLKIPDWIETCWNLMELFKEESEDNDDGKKKEEHNHFGLRVGTIVVIISVISVLFIDIVDKIFCRLWQLKALHLFVYPSVIASKFVSVCLNCIRSLIFYSTFIRTRKLSLICKQNAFFIFHLIAFFAFLGGQPPSRVKDNCKTCTRKINAKENLRKMDVK